MTERKPPYRVAVPEAGITHFLKNTSVVGDPVSPTDRIGKSATGLLRDILRRRQIGGGEVDVTISPTTPYTVTSQGTVVKGLPEEWVTGVLDAFNVPEIIPSALASLQEGKPVVLSIPTPNNT